MDNNENQEKQPKSTVGPKIWVESLLSLEEWQQNCRKYPQTCKLGSPPRFFKSDYEWRWRMGIGRTPEQIETYNKNIDYLLTFNKNEKKHNN